MNAEDRSMAASGAFPAAVPEKSAAPVRLTRSQRKAWRSGPVVTLRAMRLRKALQALRPGVPLVEIGNAPEGALLRWQDGQVWAWRKSDGAVAPLDIPE